ncbi:MAG: hypothetical protein D6678_00150 [Zetaproteobacteria bacterium]|nr:MAG: hypothetical protein D6678_00150 [Zetaproteobacteria bacterium]
MMRNLLVVFVFFFGPAILMLIARSLLFMLRLWWQARQARARETQVIDVTPVRHERPSRAFVVVAIVLGIVSAVLAYQALNTKPAPKRIYVPAHLDAQGKVVPGHWETLPRQQP